MYIHVQGHESILHQPGSAEGMGQQQRRWTADEVTPRTKHSFMVRGFTAANFLPASGWWIFNSFLSSWAARWTRFSKGTHLEAEEKQKKGNKNRTKGTFMMALSARNKTSWQIISYFFGSSPQCNCSGSQWKWSRTGALGGVRRALTPPLPRLHICYHLREHSCTSVTLTAPRFTYLLPCFYLRYHTYTSDPLSWLPRLHHSQPCFIVYYHTYTPVTSSVPSLRIRHHPSISATILPYFEKSCPFSASTLKQP